MLSEKPKKKDTNDLLDLTSGKLIEDAEPFLGYIDPDKKGNRRSMQRRVTDADALIN